MTGVQGVLFDLYGTLVAPFRKREHGAVMGDVARILGADPVRCLELWVESFPRRVRGEIATVGENFDWIAAELGLAPSAAARRAAQDRYLEHTREGLAPVPGAVELLTLLVGRGLRLGLVSNCAPDVPAVWDTSVLAPYFQFCAFSCRLGTVKPEPGIYRAALAALDLPAGRTLFVGDGSDRELSGAAACGLRPILVSVDLSNTYDSVRADVRSWTGDTVTELLDVRRYL